MVKDIRSIPSVEAFLKEFGISWNLYMECVELTIEKYTKPGQGFRNASKLRDITQDSYTLKDILDKILADTTFRHDRGSSPSEHSLLGMLFDGEVNHSATRRILTQEGISSSWSEIYNGWGVLLDTLTNSAGNLTTNIKIRESPVEIIDSEDNLNKEFNEDLV